jgi:hypothetical protein
MHARHVATANNPEGDFAATAEFDYDAKPVEQRHWEKTFATTVARTLDAETRLSN